jgi:hypothetical protein
MKILPFKTYLLPILILSLLFFFLSSLVLNADILNKDKKEEYQGNLNEIAIDTSYSTTDSLESIIGTIIRIVLAILGSIFLLLMFLAGNKWMTASGNEEQINKAKSQITSLVLGLIIILAAYALSFRGPSLLINLLTN